MQFRKKGGDKLINARSSILLRRVEMGGIDDEFRQRTAEAVMDALGKFETMRSAEQVEVSLNRSSDA